MRIYRSSCVNAGSLTPHGGRKSQLHVPLQVFVQEQQEFQTGIDDLRYRRRAGGPSRRPASAQASEHLPPDVDTVHAMLITYSKALQHALQVIASLARAQSTTRTSCSMLTVSPRQACRSFSLCKQLCTAGNDASAAGPVREWRASHQHHSAVVDGNNIRVWHTHP